jgi:hypothetical protein
MNPSRARQQLKKLMKEQEKLIDAFLGRAPLVKGTVYRMEVLCGKRGCRCAREGKLHAAWKLSRSHEGKSQTRCLKLGTLDKYKKMAHDYREFRKARKKWVKLYKQQMACIDELEAGRRDEEIWEKK